MDRSRESSSNPVVAHRSESFMPSRSASVTALDADLLNDTDLLINASLQTATRFFSAGNFRMRMATHLL
jgi:hypothetical protein